MVFKSGLNDFLDKNKNRSDQRISLKIGAIFLTRHFLFIFVFLFDSTQKVTYFRHFSVFSTPFQSIQSFYTFFVFPLSIHTLLSGKIWVEKGRAGVSARLGRTSAPVGQKLISVYLSNSSL